MDGKVKHFDTAGWDADVLGAEGLVLVDFWAEWCPPCRKLLPVIDALAGEYTGRVTVGKLNVDQHPLLASRYGIVSIPTLLLFKGGRVVEQRVGALPKADLQRVLDEHCPLAATAATAS